jgi:hypothetical protein
MVAQKELREELRSLGVTFSDLGKVGFSHEKLNTPRHHIPLDHEVYVRFNNLLEKGFERENLESFVMQCNIHGSCSKKLEESILEKMIDQLLKPNLV